METGHITVCAMPHAGGFHQASWLREGAKGNDIWNPDLWRGIARTAEKGLLDAVFFADNAALWPVPEHLRQHTAKVGAWDALIVASLVATGAPPDCRPTDLIQSHASTLNIQHTKASIPWL